MNLSVITKNAANAIKGAAGSASLVMKAHAPEIMVGTGVVGFGVTVFGACRATAKSHDILAEKETTVEAMDETLSQSEEGPGKYTLAMYNRDLKQLNRKTKLRIAKVYAPVATTGIASVVLVLGGYKILNGRYVATAAAYKTLEAGFDRYRGNVIDEFGREVDQRMLYTIKKEEMDAALQEREDNRRLEDQNGRKKHGRKKPHSRYQNIYSYIFDEYSDRWRRYWTPEQVLDYLRQKEREANDLLAIRGHVFVNEIMDLLGLERTAEGQVSGFIRTKTNPNSRVDFGLDDMPEEALREILAARRNEDIRVRIHLRPDGVIYNLIDQKDYDIVP